jgi:predicted RNA-binding protein with PUA-like domain
MAHNRTARNLMRDMRKGDYAFFYHSNCKVPGVVGVMEIVQEHSVDGLSLRSEICNSH